MSHVKISGRIPERFIDMDVYEKTFRVISPVSFSAKDVLKCLENVLKVEDISDIWKVDFQWNVTVNSREAAVLLMNIGSINYIGHEVKVESFSKQTFFVKVHWLPPYVKDGFLEAYFGGYGTVAGITREARVFDANATKRTGIRVVKLIADHGKLQEIPHLHTFTGGISMLITIPGRESLCLKCKNLGHIRRDCPLRPQARRQPMAEPRSYSDVVAPSQRHEEEKSANVQNVDSGNNEDLLSDHGEEAGVDQYENDVEMEEKRLAEKRKMDEEDRKENDSDENNGLRIDLNDADCELNGRWQKVKAKKTK